MRAAMAMAMVMAMVMAMAMAMAMAAMVAGVSADGGRCCCEDALPVMSLLQLRRGFFQYDLWLGDWQAAGFHPGEKYVPQLTERSL